MITYSRSSSLTFFGAALLAASLAACGGSDGDHQHDTTPDAGGGMDAAVEPLKPGIAILTDLERAVDVTTDGRTALLWKQSNGELYFYDVATGGLEVKTTLDVTELQNQQPHGMSDVGHIAAGYGVDPEAAGLWDATNGWKKLKSPIGPCPNDPPINAATGAAFGVTPNGKAVVGMLWDASCKNQAFLWKDTGGDGTMVPLQKVGRGTIQSERASVISADGKVVAGFAPDSDGADRSPAIWKDDGTGFLLDPEGNEGNPGEVTAISADGKLVAGLWSTPDPNWAAFGGNSGFTWTQETGVVRFSSATPGSETNIFVNAMSSDGKFIYGKDEHTTDPTDFFAPIEYWAFVWNKDKGMRKLQDVVVAAGITMPANHTLTNVMGVSGDGRVVVGTVEIAPADPTTQNPTEQLFVLVLPEGAL